MAKRFFLCEKCGNIVGLINDAGGTLSCCGQSMKELIPNTTDAAAEKHVPVITLDREGGEVTVQVGTAAHPMTAEHLIEWIHLVTEKGAQIKHLKAGDAPEAVFKLTGGDKPVAALAYCNLHGLWKADFHEDKA
ncbi:desulfoferrodoxin family protein [uncultured Mitsuokella sp.]|uniref:desulfoferrodoxin family protein n=1 Tax=uncultured Mitsuokella sp. TaxID=453120 RepID=UPI00266FD726|nr:desulfoferrodoxin family protein [uncultured Mitsuokella sp.]